MVSSVKNEKYKIFIFSVPRKKASAITSPLSQFYEAVLTYPLLM